MSINPKSMFDAIKQSLSEKKNTNSGNQTYKEVLKFESGKTYQLRLIPNPNSPKQSIFHYYNHGWNSNATGQYVTALCPTTFGDSCPIDAYYLKTYRNGTPSEKEAAKVLSRKENWMVNVYVVSDPSNPENEGKVKILRYGRELAKIIESALEGDDAELFGVEKVFDVVHGSTLRIKCEPRTDKGGGKAAKMITYASSKFLPASSLDLDDDSLTAIYDGVHDLAKVNKVSTGADMQRMLDEHFFNLSTGSTAPEDDADDDNEPVSFKSSTPTKPTSNVKTKKIDDDDEETDESTDEALRRMLEDL